ncbi:carbon monoxide dehydrogenase subunit G [Gemmobacter fulvus]|uniref:Carbon monoxide dehydrogenase subunit G n=1 Tax=Gemmobacter fulvus TaxID=2840474 RepID=A0A975P6E2_9RHOB|nr:carbon monoxide dehydrogenase subunit G [Gemmobacter fulvus]MBT9246676.1 carbon monoxide dehydrogenase subunit G [Gemmobacter fulvus]QWK89216.1 carbon monoxide dehydrogenase subunit G [Gemmobacter fulvus]
MEMEESLFIAAPQQAVWEALNDPGMLQRCIPGCTAITRKSPDEMLAKVHINIAFVQKDIVARLQHQHRSAPDRLTLVGMVGQRATGTSQIVLTPAEGGTLLTYKIKASINVSFATLGSFVINKTAKRLSGEFFARLAAELQKAHA